MREDWAARGLAVVAAILTLVSVVAATPDENGDRSWVAVAVLLWLSVVVLLLAVLLSQIRIGRR